MTAGIRPVHIDLAQQGIPAVIEVCEMMGSEMHLHATVNGKDIIIVVPTTDYKPDQFAGGNVPVNFTFDTSLLHLFNPETGKNLF